MTSKFVASKYINKGSFIILFFLGNTINTTIEMDQMLEDMDTEVVITKSGADWEADKSALEMMELLVSETEEEYSRRAEASSTTNRFT